MPHKNHNLSRDASLDYYTSEREHREHRGFAIKVAAIAVGILCVVGIALGVVASRVTNIGANMTTNDDDLLASLEEGAPDEPFYLLLLGADKGEERTETEGEDDSNYRADTIILCRIDPKETKATMVSIHRDLLVEFDADENGQRKTGKINSAYSLGGPSAMVDQVSKLAGVKIAHYAEIDFDSFMDIVDSIGGVEITLPREVRDPDYTGLDLSAGTHTLDSHDALMLCRARHAYDNYGDGDVYRAANQRSVITAILGKVLKSDPQTMVDALTTMSESLTTDLSVDEILSIASQMRDLDPEKSLYTGMTPSTPHVPEVEGDAYYEILDEEAWNAMMQRVDAGLPPYENPEDDPTAGITGEASEDAETLDEQGTEATDEEKTEGEESEEKTDETTEGEEGENAEADGTEEESTTSSNRATQSNPFLSITAMSDVDKSGVVVILGMNDGRPTQYATELTDMGFNAVAYEAAIYPFTENLVIYSDAAYEEEATAIAAYLGSDYTAMLNDGSYAMPAGSNVYVRVKAE